MWSSYSGSYHSVADSGPARWSPSWNGVLIRWFLSRITVQWGTVSSGIFVMGNSLFGGSRQVSISLSTELGRSGVSYPLWYNSRVTYRDRMAIFTFIKRRWCQDKKRKDLVKIILKELYILISTYSSEERELTTCSLQLFQFCQFKFIPHNLLCRVGNTGLSVRPSGVGVMPKINIPCHFGERVNWQY